MSLLTSDMKGAIATGRDLMPPGTRVYTNAIGKSFDLYIVRPHNGEPRIQRVSYIAAKAGACRWNNRSEACAADSGWQLVYNLSHTLYLDGFGCIGERCPSNDHSNGDRDYTPYWHRDIPKPEGKTSADYSATHWHQDGGYALRHEWLR